MCEFGYVITDTDFNISCHDEIVMSPGRGGKYEFDTRKRKNDEDFTLAYDYDYYLSQPQFPHFEKRITGILENENTILFGFSVENDIRYLEYTYRRYKFDLMDFKVYDIQILVQKVLGMNHAMSLKNALFALDLKNEYIKITEHLSSDDAKGAMIILKDLCEKTGLSVAELIEKYPESKYEAIPYLNSRAKRKEQGSENSNSPKRKTKNVCQHIWGEFYREFLDDSVKKENESKTITVSAKAKLDQEKLEKAIDLIRKRGLIPTDKISNAHCIIAVDEEEKERLLGIFKYPFSGEFAYLDDFLNEDWRMQMA